MSEGYYHGTGGKKPLVTWTSATRAIVDRLVAELPADVRVDLNLRRPAITRGRHFIAMGFEDGMAFRLLPVPLGRHPIKRGAARGMIASPAAESDSWPELLQAAYDAASD